MLDKGHICTNYLLKFCVFITHVDRICLVGHWLTIFIDPWCMLYSNWICIWSQLFSVYCKLVLPLFKRCEFGRSKFSVTTFVALYSCLLLLRLQLKYLRCSCMRSFALFSFVSKHNKNVFCSIVQIQLQIMLLKVKQLALHSILKAMASYGNYKPHMGYCSRRICAINCAIYLFALDKSNVYA